MKTLLAIFSFVAAAYLGWQHYDLSARNTELEAKSVELTAEIESTKREMESTKRDMGAANARLAQLGSSSTPSPSQTKPKVNWVEERNRNRQSTPSR